MGKESILTKVNRILKMKKLVFLTFLSAVIAQGAETIPPRAERMLIYQLGRTNGFPVIPISDRQKIAEKIKQFESEKARRQLRAEIEAARKTE